MFDNKYKFYALNLFSKPKYNHILLNKMVINQICK